MEGKPKVGKAYLFDSAPQEAFVAWRRPVTLKGRRMLIKAKDTLMDKLHGRSWYYSPDDCFLFYVVRGGYVEKRCLQELEKQDGEMTLDEAILHAEQQAELLEESAKGCDMDYRIEREIAYKSSKCAAEHRQLAEWLSELKERRERDGSDR